MVKRLGHLAKYKSVEDLDNPASQLSIKFELLDEHKQPFPDRHNIKLKSGTVYFRIQNNENIPLNIAILDLEATWAITSRLSSIANDRYDYRLLGLTIDLHTFDREISRSQLRWRRHDFDPVLRSSRQNFFRDRSQWGLGMGK